MIRTPISPVLLLFLIIVSGKGICFSDPRGYLYSPYWYSDYQTETMIEITNNALEIRTIISKIFLFGEEEIPLDPLSILPSSTVRVSLSDYFIIDERKPYSKPHGRWGNGSRENSVWGAAILEGETLQGITSWIISENEEERIAVSSIFRNLTRSFKTLKSQWWRPTNRTMVLHAIQNPSTEDQVVDSYFHFEGRMIPGKSIILASSKSVLLNIRDIFPSGISSSKVVIPKT